MKILAALSLFAFTSTAMAGGLSEHVAKNFEKIDFKQVMWVTTSPFGLYWSTSRNYLYYRFHEDIAFKEITGGISHCSAGNGMVWCVFSAKNIVAYIEGASPEKPDGDRKFKQIKPPTGHLINRVAVSDVDDSLWICTNKKKIYRRSGITDTLKEGSAWEDVSSGCQCTWITAGGAGVWCIEKGRSLKYRVGTMEEAGTKGTEWMSYTGGWDQVESGRGGIMLRKSENQRLYWINGLTPQTVLNHQLNPYTSVSIDGKKDRKIQSFDFGMDGSVFVVEKASSSNNNKPYIAKGLLNDCTCDRIEILGNQDIKVSEEGMEIIGLSTATTCSAGSRQLYLQYASSVEETSSFTATTSHEVHYSTSMTVGFTTGVSFASFSSEQSFSTTTEVGGSHKWTNSETKATTTGTSSTHGVYVSYDGPGAALALGTVKKYRYITSNLNARYYMSCDANIKYDFEGKIDMDKTTYGLAEFSSVYYTIKKNQCKQSVKQCVGNVEGNKALNDRASVEKNFGKCFANGVGELAEGKQPGEQDEYVKFLLELSSTLKKISELS